MSANPWFSWDYVTANWNELSAALVQHLSITVEAVAIAFVIALPLAALARRVTWLAAPLLGVTSVMYTIPSLALFAILVPFTGIGRTPVLIGLVMYSLLILLRNILVGLQGVDPDVLDAASGVGYGRWRRLVSVELPNALPAIVTGLRLATVSAVALVTVGTVAGFGGLGTIMFGGFNANFYRAPIMTATILTVALAAVLDLAIYLLGRLLAPWARSSRVRRASRRTRRAAPAGVQASGALKHVTAGKGAAA